MKIEIRATYPATDGSTPEDVSVEIDTEPLTVAGGDTSPGVPTGEVVALILPILGQMLAAPAQRPPAAEALTSVRRFSANSPAEPMCQRALCGHPRWAHDLYETDEEISALERGVQGRCSICANSDRCRSYVGPVESEPVGQADRAVYKTAEWLPKNCQVGFTPGDPLLRKFSNGMIAAGIACEQMAEGAEVENRQTTPRLGGLWYLSRKGQS
jgi:hypothetical protein